MPLFSLPTTDHLKTLPSRFAKIIPAALTSKSPAPCSAQPVPELNTLHRRQPDLDKHLFIPVCETPLEEQTRSAHFERGQFLVRQDRWEDLVQEIKQADSERLATNGGMPVAELLAQGARADIVAIAEHLLQDGDLDDLSPLEAAISALDEILHDHPQSPEICVIVALAHLDIAWAWRDCAVSAELTARCQPEFRKHCTISRSLLDPYCGLELDSPLVTAARCALQVGVSTRGMSAADDYEDLIDLAPRQQSHIRALGHHMLPKWLGSYEILELEARRTAARTQDIWGAGAYTWAYFDALLVDPQCAATLDVAFFLEGMRDILDRSDDQHYANLFAAYCSVSLPAVTASCPDTFEATIALEALQEAARWVMADYLHELHPLIWGHAIEGFNNQARIASVDAMFTKGREKAHQVFLRHFGDQMRKGHALIFTPQGLFVQQA